MEKSSWVDCWDKGVLRTITSYLWHPCQGPDSATLDRNIEALGGSMVHVGSSVRGGDSAFKGLYVQRGFLTEGR